MIHKRSEIALIIALKLLGMLRAPITNETREMTDNVVIATLKLVAFRVPISFDIPPLTPLLALINFMQIATTLRRRWSSVDLNICERVANNAKVLPPLL